VGGLEIVHAPGPARLGRVDPYASADVAAASARRARANSTRTTSRARSRGTLGGVRPRAAPPLRRRARARLAHLSGGLAAKQASGRPFVAHVHATERDRSGPAGDSSSAAAIERRTFPVADRIVAVSRYTAGILRDHYGVTAERIRWCTTPWTGWTRRSRRAAADVRRSSCSRAA
jgi:hypothetical protein